MRSEKDREELSNNIKRLEDNLRIISESHERIRDDYDNRLLNYERSLEQSFWTDKEREFFEEHKFRLMKMKDMEESHHDYFAHEFTKEIEFNEEEIKDIDRELEKVKEEEEKQEKQEKEE